MKIIPRNLNFENNYHITNNNNSNNISQRLHQYQNNTPNNIEYNQEVIEDNNLENNMKEDPYGDNYTGLGILPRPLSNEKMQKLARQEALKNFLEKEIEEKKEREAREKHLRIEQELKEDLKVQKAIEEEKQQLKLEKLQKEEKEKKIMMTNLMNSQNNSSPKKKLIDIDEFYNKNTPNANNNTINFTNNNISTMNRNIYNNRVNNNTLNILSNIEKIQEETENGVNNFNVDVIEGEENNPIDNEIAILRNEVRNQYKEMHDLFYNLRNSISETEQYKRGLDRKGKMIKEELLKNQIARNLNQNVYNQTYEQNMNSNYDELYSKNNNNNLSSVDSNNHLQGTSDFIYENNKDNTLGKNQSTTLDNYQLLPNSNQNNINDIISPLMLTGRNIIELKSENELVSIKKDENKNELNEKIMKQMKEENQKNPTMDDLYKELNIIEEINHNLASVNKIGTLRNNFDVDYEYIRHKEKHKINQFRDNM